MARGAQVAANTVSEQIGKTTQNWSTDSYVVILCSDEFAAVAAFTNRSQFTEVSGGAYAPIAITQTFTRAGADSTFQATDVRWAIDASGPQDIRIAVVVNITAVGQDDVLTVIDLTTDGTTPIDNQVDPISINFASSPTLVVSR